MNNRILLIFPNPGVKEQIYKKEEFLIVEENGVTFFDKKSKKRKLCVKSNKIFYSLNQIRDQLNWWIPIFERWIGKSYFFEEYRTKILEIINHIEDLKRIYKLETIVHFTAIPHHLISIAMNIYGSISSTKQIFFYSSIFDGRLIPISQDQKNNKRKIILYKKTKINYTKLIDEFIENKLQNNPPKLNHIITKKNQSLSYVILLLSLKFLKNSILRIKPKNLNKKELFFFNENKFSISNYFELIRRQTKFLNAYERISIKNESFIKEIEKSKKALLIAAHFQPEATSFPEGGLYMNHIDIVNRLRQIGYNDTIFYKEHQGSNLYMDLPSIFITKVSIYKNLSFLEYLKKLNVTFIKQSFPLESKGKLSEMYLPITITGTLAIERSLVGLKTIICGDPIYNGLPGTIHIDEIKNKNFLNRINLKKDFRIATNAKVFLKNFLDNNTLSNPFGIGNGIRTNKDKNELVDFLKYINIK